jgi:LacI family transcriptional regulator
MIGKGFPKVTSYPSIRDVAAAAGVSMATVSKALNGTGRLRSETRERVGAVARELGYVPNAHARSLLEGRTYAVGLLTSDTVGRFSIPLMRGIEDGLGKGRTLVLLCDSRGDPIREQHYVDALLARRVDGIIVTGERTDPRQSIRDRLPFPVVYAYARSEAASDLSIVPDDEQGGRLAAERFLALGRRRIAHIAGPSDYMAARDREAGFRRALADAGVEVASSMVIAGPWSESWGREAAGRLLGQDRELDAIFCASDQIGRGVADHLRDRGVRIPDDIALIGFDNWESMAAETQPPLTSVDPELADLGRLAAQKLLAIVEGDTTGGLIRHPCGLVERESTRVAPPASAIPNRRTTTGMNKQLRRFGVNGGWKKYAGNPVLGGIWAHCYDPTVLKEGAKFRMWYGWRPKHVIAYTESDDGINWSTPQVALEPTNDDSWQSQLLDRQSVLKAHGRYEMFFSAQRTKPPNHAYVEGGSAAIGFAVSDDGLQWERVTNDPVLTATEPWEKATVMCPCVIWDESEQIYKMWYSGGQHHEPDAIGYATSKDGLTWTKCTANPMFIPDPANSWDGFKVAAPQVFLLDDWYVMFYIGYFDEYHAQIGIARSRDGITNWFRHPANPIIAPDHDTWDAQGCYKPFAVPDGDRWLLWYNGASRYVERFKRDPDGTIRRYPADAEVEGGFEQFGPGMGRGRLLGDGAAEIHDERNAAVQDDLQLEEIGVAIHEGMDLGFPEADR